jgi:hypothetical protein
MDEVRFEPAAPWTATVIQAKHDNGSVSPLEK